MGKASFTEALLSDTDNSRKCDLSRAFIKMDASMASEVKQAMASPEITAAAIARTLQRFDYPINEGSVRRCRRTCHCWQAV